MNNMSNEAILAVKGGVNACGPHAVVAKDTGEGWAVVALHWFEEPRLGIRWFATPGKAVDFPAGAWFIIPEALEGGLLQDLPASPQWLSQVRKFLRGKLDRKDLDPGRVA